MTEAFSEDIKALVKLQNQMKAIAAETKQRRDPIKTKLEEVKTRVMNFMKTQDVEVCNFANEKIELKRGERFNPLNKKSLLEALVQYFGDEERAQTCFNALMVTIGKKQTEALRVTKAKKPKTPKRKKLEVDGSESDEDEDVNTLRQRGVQQQQQVEESEESEDDEAPPALDASSDEE